MRCVSQYNSISCLKIGINQSDAKILDDHRLPDADKNNTYATPRQKLDYIEFIPGHFGHQLREKNA